MIDFEDCKIRSLCHPGRVKGAYSSRLEDEMMDILEDEAQAADEEIREKEYDAAITRLESMIERLQDFEEAVHSDNESLYGEIYEEVSNRSYHGRIVRAAEEHGMKLCVLGALKAAKKDLEEQPF